MPQAEEGTKINAPDDVRGAKKIKGKNICFLPQSPERPPFLKEEFIFFVYPVEDKFSEGEKQRPEIRLHLKLESRREGESLKVHGPKPDSTLNTCRISSTFSVSRTENRI